MLLLFFRLVITGGVVDSQEPLNETLILDLTRQEEWTWEVVDSMPQPRVHHLLFRWG